MKQCTYKIFSTIVLAVLVVVNAFSQGAPACPSINAGNDQTICSGSTANLTATAVSSNGTGSYSVSSIPNSPYPYSGGTLVSVNTDDVWSGIINMPFNFCYFGNTYNQCVIGSNGQLSFDITNANGYDGWPVTTALPSTVDQPGNTIDAVFRDIDPELGGSVGYYVTGTAPCRALVVYWNNVPLYDNGYGTCDNTPNSSFQLVLYENTNFIDVYVGNSYSCSVWNGGYGIIGIQNASATTAVTPPNRNYPSTWTTTGEAWRFTPTGAPNYSVTWTIPPSSTVVATGLTASVSPTTTTHYQANMTLTNCDGNTITSTDTVTVFVTPGQNLAVTAAPNAVCSGDTSMLVASGSTTYSWAPSTGLSATTGDTVSAYPTTTTTYTVTGTNSTGCVSTKTVTITVAPSPAVVCTPSAPTLCQGDSTILAASGASTYTWSPATGLSATTGDTVTAIPSSTTTYTITGTNSSGCADTQSVTVNVNIPPNVVLNSSNSAICSGSSTTLTASGAISYSWSPSTGLSATTGDTVTANPTTTTTYTVIGTDANGCSDTRTITVTVNQAPLVTLTAASSTICDGSSTTLTAGGASTYSWSPSTGLSATTGSPVTASPTATTTYTVIGTDANGCSDTQSVTITVNPLPIISCLPASPTICSSGGYVHLTAGGASTYSWAPATGLTTTTGDTVTAAPAATTTYTITGTDANGCVNTDTVTVTVKTSLVVICTPSSPAICVGDSTTLTASGASVYSWSPATGLSSTSGVSVVANPTTTTTYLISGSGGYSTCSDTQSVTVTVNPLPTVTCTPASPTICYGDSTSLTANGASTYTWSPATGLSATTGSTVMDTPTATTTYTITGTDSNGCVNTQTVTTTVNPLPTITCTPAASTICYGDSTSLTAAGGSSYSWAPATGLSATTGATVTAKPGTTTTYTITGTDANGCMNTKTVTITVNALPVITCTPISPSICSGSSVTLNTSGAATYNWSPATGLNTTTGSSVIASPTSATTYTITGTDSNGCVNTHQVTVGVNPLPNVAITGGTFICHLGDSVTLAATSGYPGYSWSNGGTTQSITVGPSTTTTYTVTVTDSNSCTNQANFNVLSGGFIQDVMTPQNVSCNGAGNGSASVSATGGYGNVSYQWSPVSGTGSSVSGLSPGTYMVTITDTLGCSKTDSVAIAQPAVLVTSTQSTDVNCFGGSDGTASTSPSGGNSGYTYVWSPTGGNGPIASNLSAGIYTVTVTDALGCSTTDTVTVGQPAQALVSSATKQDLPCNGDSTGVAIVSASGGTSPYSYAWSNGVMQPTNNNLFAGTYTVTVTDAHNCTSIDTVTILQPPAISLALNTVPTCKDSCMGSASAVVSGGVPPYSIVWNNSTTGTMLSGLCQGQNSVTVTDSNGCKLLNTFNIAPFPVLNPVIYPLPTDSGNAPLQVLLTDSTNGYVSGWQWDFGDHSGIDTSASPTHTYMNVGEYPVSLTVMDTNGCAYETTYNFIIVAPEVNAVVPNVFSPNGDGNNDIFKVDIDASAVLKMDGRIFDRWGNQVYEWTTPEGGWDGRNPSGVRESDGTYFYIIKLETYDHKNKVLAGHLTLIK